MRVRKGLWSLRRGSAVPPRRLSASSLAWLREPTDSGGPAQLQRPQLDRAPGARGAVTPRGLRSRDPLRVSSAAAHSVMARFP